LARLNIPSRYKAAIAQIRSLSDGAFGELRSALERFQPFPLDNKTVARIADSTPNIAPDDIERILESLMGLELARAMAELTLDQFCTEVVTEIGKGATEPSEIAEDNRKKFVYRLEELLSSDLLTIAAKSRDLQTEHDRVYMNGRVITDIRPVFRGGPEESPAGFVLFHVLRLTYWDRGRDGERGSIYLAMDEGDVSNLKKLLERAELKSKTLRAQLQKSEIQVLGENRSS
jgi:hypothetical protein